MEAKRIRKHTLLQGLDLKEFISLMGKLFQKESRLTKSFLSNTWEIFHGKQIFHEFVQHQNPNHTLRIEGFLQVWANSLQDSGQQHPVRRIPSSCKMESIEQIQVSKGGMQQKLLEIAFPTWYHKWLLL
jgi:hypothetical protein